MFEWLYNLFTSEVFLGNFLGAFFAFIFFLFGEWIITIAKIVMDDRKEHIYLERYFNDLYGALLRDKKLLMQIIKDYESDDCNIADLASLPLRESAITKINDYMFINRLSLYFANIKTLNADLENINKLKNKINDNLNSSSEETKKEAKRSLEKFMIQLKDFEKLFDFHLERIWDFAAENKISMRKFRLVDFEKNTEEGFLKRKEEVEKEKIQLKEDKKKDSIMADYLDTAREFGLKVDSD
jgi:hypothetical protein